MADAKSNQEPSMEEILASIRRIISEGEEPKDDAPATPAANGHAEDDDDDALVLTDMVVGDSNVVELKEEVPESAPVSAPPPLDVAMDEPAPAAPPQMPEPAPAVRAAEAAPQPEPEPTPPEPAQEPDPESIELEEEEVTAADEMDMAPLPEMDPDQAGDTGFPAIPGSPEEGDLVSPNVAAASAATMAQLIARKASTAVPRNQILDGLLVETLVRQAVEPMLKDWLDEHLQEIVERLVRREVERLARKAELG